MNSSSSHVVGWGRRHTARSLASIGVLMAGLLPAPGHAAGPATLLRIPYLTDVTSSSAIVNFATSVADTAQTHAVVTYGPLAGGCTGSTVTATLNAPLFSITPPGGTATRLYQYKAQLTGLNPEAQYCYDVNQGGELLGNSAGLPPGWTTTFTTLRQTDALGGAYSFAVIGDFGSGPATP